MAKASERDRYKYGICTNRDQDGKPCPKCESKDVQSVRMGQDFVCEECKESLRQVPAPKPKTSGKKIAIITAVVLLLGGGTAAYFALSSGESKTTVTGDPKGGKDTTTVVDPPKTPVEGEPHVVIESGDANTGTGRGTISFSYGKYTGEIKNFKANGMGALQFFKQRRLSMLDKQERMAEPKDVADGEFVDNEFARGKWFDGDKNQKGSLITGKVGVPD